MATNVIMPQLGESVVEGTISKWLKQEGEAVNEFDPLMEVNTDKVDTEIPAPATGTLLKVLVPAGATVKAGAVLAVIGQPGEAPPGGQAAGAFAAAKAASLLSAPFLPPTPAKRDLGFISPVVARLADEYKVDLRLVTGTGQGGRITKKDVLAHVEATKAPPAEAAAPQVELPPWERPGEGEVFQPGEAAQPAAAPAVIQTPGAQPEAVEEQSLPVVGMRKSIAEHMVRSEHTAPHVTTVFEADLSRVLAHLEVHKARFALDGVSLTLTAYFVSAAVSALRAVPLVNSQWAEDKIILKREINIGIAVALDEGLIVPVIKRADEKSLLGLAREVNELARRARAKALKPDEVVGGTFTLTNHGVSGSLFATPIINQPQAGILGVGMMQKRALVIHDAIAIRPMVYVTLTFDHRVLDGAVADRFMAKVKETLEGWS